MTGQPCWYVDGGVWGEVHFPTETEARAAADAEVRDDEPTIGRHRKPCVEFTCRDCGGTYHALGPVPADGLCGEC